MRIATVQDVEPGVPNHYMHLLARSWATWVNVLNFLLANDSTINDLKASCESSSGHQLLSPTKIVPSRSGFTKVASKSFVISSVCVICFSNVLCSNSNFSLFILKRSVAFFLRASSSYYLVTVSFFTSEGSGAILLLACLYTGTRRLSSRISALSSPDGLTCFSLKSFLATLIVFYLFNLYLEFFS